MSILDLVNTRRVMDHAAKVARSAVGQCKTESTDQEKIEAIERMYRGMGLDATVEQETRLEERSEFPPPVSAEVDGSVQVGEGDGVTTRTVEKIPIPGHYEITIRANQRATKIKIASTVLSIPHKPV